jgi:hypothetical protein
VHPGDLVIVALEGLMCVGKTSSIARLASGRAGTHVVAEVLPRALVEQQPRFAHAGESDFYVRNDHAKSSILESRTLGELVLMDRYFVSTVAYKLARDYGRPDAGRTRDEIHRLFPGVRQPDCWILLEENAGRSCERAAQLRPELLIGLWASPDAVARLAGELRCAIDVVRTLQDHTAVYVVSSDRVFHVPWTLDDILEQEAARLRAGG